MSIWNLTFTEEAEEDLADLDYSQRAIVAKSLQKVLKNPLPNSEGGYGKPLGNKGGLNLTGCLKIKFRALGIRAIYRLIRQENEMQMLVIGLRADDEVYRIADKRLKKLLERENKKNKI